MARDVPRPTDNWRPFPLGPRTPISPGAGAIWSPEGPPRMQPPLVDRESPPTCAPGEYQGCRPPADTPPAAGDGSRFPPAPPDVVLPDVVVSAPRPTMRERRKRETRSVLRTLGNIALDLILGRIRGPLGAVVRALPRRMPGGRPDPRRGRPATRTRPERRTPDPRRRREERRRTPTPVLPRTPSPIFTPKRVPSVRPSTMPGQVPSPSGKPAARPVVRPGSPPIARPAPSSRPISRPAPRPAPRPSPLPQLRPLTRGLLAPRVVPRFRPPVVAARPPRQ